MRKCAISNSGSDGSDDDDDDDDCDEGDRRDCIFDFLLKFSV